MPAKTSAPTATQTPSFETVWALLKEVAENQKETDRQMKEKSDEFYLQLGHLTNLFGHFTVSMIAPMLREKFRDLGFIFQRSNTNVLVDDYINKIHFEIDIILENSNKAVLVEVKTKLTMDRVLKQIERLRKMRRYANLHGDKRTFLGAFAGFSIPDELKAFALDEGLFVIEPSGEDFNITPPKGDPKEW